MATPRDYMAMSQPTLYVKRGCPYCAAAMDYLEDHQIAYRKIDVVGNDSAMEELKKVSGQGKTPTLIWDGDVLADFGVNDLESFLSQRSSRPAT
jgi:glutaredoxin 3